jgi:hypothetical protein
MNVKGLSIERERAIPTSGAIHRLMDIPGNLFGVDVTQSPIGLVQFSISANK